MTPETIENIQLIHKERNPERDIKKITKIEQNHKNNPSFSVAIPEVKMADKT